MKSQIENTDAVCSVSKIAALLEGELSAKAENDLELHFAACRSCREELNFQKQILSGLDLKLEDLPEIPKNFTKIVVARAEANVSGLRRKDERFRALFICAALFFLVVLGLGSETTAFVSAFGSFANQVLAVGGFVVHLLFDLMVGLTVIVKVLSHQFSPTGFLAIIIFTAFAVLGLLLISRSKLVFSRL